MEFTQEMLNKLREAVSKVMGTSKYYIYDGEYDFYSEEKKKWIFSLWIIPDHIGTIKIIKGRYWVYYTDFYNEKCRCSLSESALKLLGIKE